MPTQVQVRRGTTAEHSSFTGAVGELTVDTDKDVVVVHDGSTAGGRPMLRQDQSNLPTSAPSNGVYLPSSNNVAISTNGTQRLLIDANGNVNIDSNTLYVDAVNNRVGIGTTSPTAPLTLVANSSAESIRALGRSSDNIGQIFLASNAGTDYGGIRGASDEVRLSTFGAIPLTFYANGSERGRFDTSGRLLVGTSSSVATGGVAAVQQIIGNATNDRPLGIHWGGASATGPYMTLSKSRNSTYGSYTIVNNGDVLGGLIFAGDDGTDYATQGAYIEAIVDGTPGANDLPTRLVFSTTADGASSPTERFRIDNAGRCKVTGGILRVDPSNSANGAYLVFASNQLQVGNDSAGSTSYVYLAAGGTSWTASSDERQKSDLQPIDDGLNKVGQLRSVTGRYASDDPSVRRSFLIAQDVQAVLPEAVDATNPDSLGVSYTDVIPLLVAALKESKERIETLEAKVMALESN